MRSQILCPAVLYLRYSSDNQTEQSIEGQRRVCQEYAERSGYDISGEYIDRARSATTDNRPEFRRMIADAAKGGFKFIIVYKLDRFARNRYDSAMYKHTLKKYGVRVVSATEYLSTNPESIMTEAVLEANAEYFSAELSQKTKRGMRESALKGLSTGGTVPLGYRLVDKRLEIDVNTAPAVKLIFEMYGSGKGKKEIVDELNNRGYRTKTGREFKITSLENILKNQKYIGVYHYDDNTGNPITIENSCPSLIDKNLFDTVQKKIEQTKRAPAQAKAKVDYVLSGKLFCGECGSLMVGESGKSCGGMTYHYYNCSRRKKYHDCKKKLERKDFIEWYICKCVLELFKDDDRQAEIADTIIAAYKKTFGTSGIDDLEKRLRAVRLKIDNVVDLIAETGNRAMMAKLEALQVQEDEINDELQAAKIAERHIPTQKEIMKMLSNLRGVDICDPDKRYNIINIFINRVYLWDTKMIIFFNHKNTSQTVEFEEIRQFEKSFDDSENCSDLNGVGEPNLNLSEQIIIINGVFGVKLSR